MKKNPYTILLSFLLASAMSSTYGMDANEFDPFTNTSMSRSQSTQNFQDDDERLSLILLAAEKGDAVTQNKLGYAYEYGKGVPKDETEAVRWYQKAADQGYAKAQLNLGVCYDNGSAPCSKLQCWAMVVQLLH